MLIRLRLGLCPRLRLLLPLLWPIRIRQLTLIPNTPAYTHSHTHTPTRTPTPTLIRTPIEEVYQNDKLNLDFLTDSYKNNFNFEIGINQEIFPINSGERRFSPMDRSLRRELKSTFGNNNYWFNTSKFKNAVEIKIRSNNDVIEFLVPKEMVSASSVRIFVLWTTLPSLVLIIIALIFLKNQTKPLVKLAKAAERFGKGDYVNDFRASGSQEIRKAAFEFDRMAKRINIRFHHSIS